MYADVPIFWGMSPVHEDSQTPVVVLVLSRATRRMEWRARF